MTLMDGNEAGAWGARLARVGVVPNFPITPQTELIEVLAKWKSDGLFKGEFLDVESEHSVLSAAIASEVTGVRTFTATSSQGLLLMHEMMYTASGMRLPIVMINVSRALSAPINIWNDHNDFLDQRDSGWLMFVASDNQDTVDFTLQAFKIAEDKKVSLPCMINLDGFILSYTREPVSIPTQSKVDKFLPKYEPLTILDPSKPMNVGVPAMHEYMEFRLQQQAAMNNAKEAIEESFKKWDKKFGRKYGLIENYHVADSDIALVSIGAMSSTAKAAVSEARSRGVNVGLVKINVLRPFPSQEIRNSLRDVKGVGVIDQNLAPGFGGILCPEIKSALFGEHPIVNNYIIGLGGKPVYKSTYLRIIDDLKNATRRKRGNRLKFVE